MKITLLGTGTSQGVPLIGCDCEVCTSTDPKDKRLRTSALIRTETTTIVFDSGPDFRQQMLNSGNRLLSGIVFSHAHKDHTAGLDDIRPFFFQSGKPVDIYGTQATLGQIREEFGYMFSAQKYPGVPDVNLNFITADQDFFVGDLQITPFQMKHAQMQVLGFRVGDIAYITDASEIPEKSLQKLKNLRILVINALRKTDHPSHFSLEGAMKISRFLQPAQTVFTHISHQMGKQAEVNTELPHDMHLGWDGMTLEG